MKRKNKDFEFRKKKEEKSDNPGKIQKITIPPLQDQVNVILLT